MVKMRARGGVHAADSCCCSDLPPSATDTVPPMPVCSALKGTPKVVWASAVSVAASWRRMPGAFDDAELALSPADDTEPAAASGWRCVLAAEKALDGTPCAVVNGSRFSACASAGWAKLRRLGSVCPAPRCPWELGWLWAPRLEEASDTLLPRLSRGGVGAARARAEAVEAALGAIELEGGAERNAWLNCRCPEAALARGCTGCMPL